MRIASANSRGVLRRRGPRRRSAGRGGPQGWIYGFLLILSCGLFALDSADHFFADQLRSSATDAVTPVLHGASGAILTVKAWIGDTRDYAFMSDEVDRLRDENRALRDWRRRASELESRVHQFQAMLKLQPDPSVKVISARAIADTSGPFARSLIINAGSQSGVSEGHAVLGAEGLIGRVIAAGEQSSRVLLLTDLASRVPVHVGGGRHRAILAGTNSAEPTIQYVASTAPLIDGDIVTTSGEGRVMPPNVPIGTITVLDRDRITVTLATRPSEAEFVRVLNYRVPVDVAGGSPPLPAVLLSADEQLARDQAAVIPAAVQTAEVGDVEAVAATPVAAEQ